MAGLMSRASAVVRAKLAKLLDRAEDPGETLDYSYERQLQLLQNVKRGIADVTTAKKRLEMQYTSMQQQVEKLDGQARQALEAGREGILLLGGGGAHRYSACFWIACPPNCSRSAARTRWV